MGTGLKNLKEKKKEHIAKYRIYGYLYNLIYFGNGQSFSASTGWKNLLIFLFLYQFIEINTFSLVIYRLLPLPIHLVKLFPSGQSIKLKIDTTTFISSVRINPTLAQWFPPCMPVELTMCYLDHIGSQSTHVKVALHKKGKNFCAQKSGEITSLCSTFSSMKPQRW